MPISREEHRKRDREAKRVKRYEARKHLLRRQCEVCGAEIVSQRRTKRFCSSTCRVRSYRTGDAKPKKTTITVASVNDIESVRVNNNHFELVHKQSGKLIGTVTRLSNRMWQADNMKGIEGTPAKTRSGAVLAFVKALQEAK